ncbi:glycoside hydrolase family 16 protein [Trueperella pyogenes]|uniref:glycoside hydrolase family 16 protein n=1 Tax=Trueperella pyogenes TaxID=1661 RepID=UPI002167A2D1|nr:glycoside hydrolase family 16 protein [Trueperella pyogenes]UVJ55823.1 glycoside hydrolase family 16 protein [Trueperella pyogenes]
MKISKVTATVALAALVFGNGVVAAQTAVAAPAVDATVAAADNAVTTNVLKGKIPTTNVPDTLKGEAEATDGSTAYKGDESGVTEIAAGEENKNLELNGWKTWKDVYLQYGLDAPREIREVRLYHNQYKTSISTFKNVRVQIATDDQFEKVVFDSDVADFKETKDKKGEPQVIPMPKPVTGQYVRVWQRGHYIESTSSDWKGMSNKVRFREIEVMATATEDEAKQAAPRNIALGKVPYVWGLTPTNIEAITDGKWDENYAVHNTPGENWLQFEFKNTYDMKSIKLGLEPGTYDSIKAYVLNGPSATISKSTGLPEGAPAPVYTVSKHKVEGPIDIQLPGNQKGSTVRFVVKKNNDSPVKYSEVEIQASGDSYDETDAAYVAPKSKYDTLVWADEFNGPKIDESKWNIIDGMANHGAIYNRGAVGIKKGLEGDKDNGYLAINSKNHGTKEALKKAVGWDPYPGQSLNDKQTWSSGRLESKNKYSFEHGRMAVRAKVNDSQGIWPAIWMLAQDETGHDEIDVLEYLGQEPWTAYMTNHFGVQKHTYSKDHGTASIYEAWSQKFHVYEVEWSPEEITWFIDGKKWFSTKKDCTPSCDSRHTLPMFPILETQVGDGWVGDVDYNKRWTKQDSDFLVDWVRVYQKADQDRVRFDDLEQNRPADGIYRLSPVSQDNVIAKTDGEGPADNKNYFFYGGQPRYEDSRLISADKPGEIVYKANGLNEVRLTTYYKTVPGYKDRNGEGKSIRSVLTGKLDFTIMTSADGKKWDSHELKVHNNFVEPSPAYARHTMYVRGLPADAAYVKIVFPKVAGVTYKHGGKDVPVVSEDVQLAKVTFLQKKHAVDWTELTPAKPGKFSVPWTELTPATPKPSAPVVVQVENAEAENPGTIVASAPAPAGRNLAHTGAAVVSLAVLSAGLLGVGLLMRRRARDR